MISLDDIMLQVGNEYKMKCIAGKEGCSHPIGWVHIVEDPTIIQFLWSNDLALTLGLGFQSEKALMDCIIKLVKRNCVGLIINTGKYINEIPDSILRYCDQNQFPLITIPWEINVNMVIKDISIRCQQDSMGEQKLAQYFIKGFKNEEKLEQYRDELKSHFDTEGSFQISIVHISNLENTDIQHQRILARLQFYFGTIQCKYIFFWYENNLILITNNLPMHSLQSVCEKVIHITKIKLEDFPVFIGIGNSEIDLKSLPKNYKKAKAALKYALHFNHSISRFKDIGMYQILYSIEDESIIENYYRECFHPLIEYDLKHHSQLLLTFEYFLKYKGAIQIVAQELYTHRNTINYRISKIKSLLNCDLEDSEETFKYALAFYIKKKE